MYKIKSVDITGFWGNKHITANMDSDVTIFIGDNGTGKTTFINLIYSVLTVDLSILSTLDFDNISIFLFDNIMKRQKTVSVTKKEIDELHDGIEYKISKMHYKFPIESEDLYALRRRSMYMRRNELIIQECREELSKVLKINWISVYRNKDNNEDRDTSHGSILSPVDKRLSDLLQDLKNMQLKNDQEINKISKQFQEDVLGELLFDKKNDKFQITDWKDFDSEKWSEDLKTAYQELGVAKSKIQDKIKMHIDAINGAIQKVKQNVNNTPLEGNVVFPLLLLNKTNHIIELSKTTEKKKEEINSQLFLYKKIIERYLKNKTVDLDLLREGIVINNDNGKHLKINYLSSGEKQLLILLTEALLQNKESRVFIADEPELSLHVLWQKELIPSIVEINPNAQIIVATHSPEVAGKYKSKIVNIKKCFMD